MRKSNKSSANYPPCKSACPILTDVREYVQLIAERKFTDAFASIRRQNPLPRVCGRICTHPCETACKRGQVEEPIAIAALKRFAADGLWADQYKAALAIESTGHKVAIVGSGPAGLAVAHDLALLGHSVTIFEALPVAGGMLRVGVPEYRLPKDVVAAEIEAIVALGVEVKTGVKIGKDIKLSKLSEQGFQAVFLAIGAHKDRKLGIAGEDELEGVVSAVSFLRAVNLGESPQVGKQVAVVGGGNTAIDSARSLLRMGAKVVSVVYRRSKEEMPAAEEEIEEAIHEGVEMAYLTSPVKIFGEDGRVSALKCIKNELGKPDAGGRRRPEPVSGSEFSLDVDMVVCAIGQAPESSLFADELKLSETGERIYVEASGSLATSLPAIFAGGDAVTGPATAIGAIAAGKQAAVSIDLYLRSKELPSVEKDKREETQALPSTVLERTRSFSRPSKINLSVDDRLKGFDEVEACLSEDRATQEALRCLHCYLGAKVDEERCISCLTCVRACPLGVPTVSKMGEISIDSFACQACGICVLECPVQAIDIDLDSRAKIFKHMETAMAGVQGLCPLIVGFFDFHGNFGAGDIESLRRDYPNIIPVMVFGVRRIDTVDIFKAFALGADGVFIARCPSDNDPFPEITDRIDRRVSYAGRLLEACGKKKEQLDICNMPKEGLVEKEWADDLIGKIKGMS